MKYLALLATLAICLGAVACKKAATSTSTAPAVSVTIFPTATQSVLPGGTLNFTATVANTTNTSINWEVNNNVGGDITTGTISTSGVYTAPSANNVINPFDVTITAQSAADMSKTASTTVAVILPPAVVLSPTSATVPAGATQQFTVTTTPANSAVTWQVNGQVGGNATVGTITQAGLYTAPQVPLASGAVSIQAVLQSDSTKFAAAAATLTYSNFSLQKSYAFLLRGSDPSGLLLRVGTFTADGKGAITGGLEDINNGAGLIQTGVTLTGNYTINGDGRGIVTFNAGFIPPGAGNFKFSVVIVSAQQVQMQEMDTVASASGEADLQTASPFANSSFQGEYTFDFSGADSSGRPISTIGQIFADGIGGTNQPAQEDVNDNGTTAFSTPNFFFLPIAANGHGLARLDNVSYSFYMVSSQQVNFISIDPGSVVAGTATQQAGAPFSGASIGGNFLIFTNGTSTAGPIVGPISTAASFFAAGGTISTGVLTSNNAGSVPAPSNFNGTYTVAASGRGTAALSTGQTYVFYLNSVNQGVIQETDHSIVSDGSLMTVAGGPFSTGNLSNGYALQLTGIGVGQGEQDALGQITLLSGQVETGTVDVNTASSGGATTAFTPNSGVAIPGGTTYSIVNNVGPFSVTLSGTNLTFEAYFLSSTSVFLLRTDTADARVLHGNLYQDVSLSPVIVSAGTASFSVGVPGTFTVTATGNPAPTLTETGTLPSGVTFNPLTGNLSGTPASGTGGTTTQNYPITFTATNGVGSPAVQNFTLTVVQCLILNNGTCTN